MQIVFMKLVVPLFYINIMYKKLLKIINKNIPN